MKDNYFELRRPTFIEYQRAMIVGAMIVGATIVVGTMIVGAIIVGAMIVREMIVGTMIVGAVTVGAMRRPRLKATTANISVYTVVTLHWQCMH